jgi:hypothetical protein
MEVIAVRFGTIDVSFRRKDGTEDAKAPLMAPSAVVTPMAM